MLVCAGVAILRHKDSIVSDTFKSPVVPWALIILTVVSEFGLFHFWTTPALRIVFGVLLAIAVIGALVVSLSYRGFIVKRPFSSPLVPLVPLLGIMTCVYLMLGLPHITWIRFFVWLAIGMVIYFFYGIRHTKYDDDEPEAPKPSDDIVPPGSAQAGKE